MKEIDVDALASRAKGINIEHFKAVQNYFDKVISNRNTPLYIFINPDLEEYSEQLNISVKDIHNTMQTLASFFPNYCETKAMLTNDELFYELQEEDFAEINEEGTLHNPDDPRIVYDNPKEIIRHAFVLKNCA